MQIEIPTSRFLLLPKRVFMVFLGKRHNLMPSQRATLHLMEAIFLIGMQGAGKSTFYRRTFFDTHVRVNLDQLRTRRREEILIRACLEAKMRFVWDNTNASRGERSRVLQLAAASGFRAFAFYFEPDYAASSARNAARSLRTRVPEIALKNTRARLEEPHWNEGFTAIFSVWNRGARGFQIEEWQHEI